MNTTVLMQKFEGAAAIGLLRAAVFLQLQLRQRLERKVNDYQNSNPSAPGEYPAVVTGALRDGVLYEPTTPAQVAKEGEVRVGYAANTNYGAILELRKKRLGIEKTVQDLLPQLSALAVEGAARGSP